MYNDEHNYYYHTKDKPKITDAEFDKLKLEILELEKDYKFLKIKDSPSISLGHKPSKNFKKKSHRVPMLSLANAFTEEDLMNYEKKIFNYLDKKESFQIEYSAEPKIDGISASLIYKNKKKIELLEKGKSTDLYKSVLEKFPDANLIDVISKEEK